MNDLLDRALRAHGLERWNHVRSVRMVASITGAILYVKSKPDALKSVVMTGDDFAIGNAGWLYVTTNPENSVVRLDMSDTLGRERS